MKRLLPLALLPLLALVACERATETRDRDGRTPLIRAAESGDNALVRSLLSERANVNAVDHCAWSPLMKAALQGHVDTVRTLLAHGASVETRDNAGYSALMVAAGNGHAAVVDLLIEHGALVDASEPINGQTALQWAAQRGFTEVVTRLLAAGADPSRTDRHGRDAAQYARDAGQTQLADDLQARRQALTH